MNPAPQAGDARAPKQTPQQDKRALKQQYRESTVPAGVFTIRNLDSGRVLLGASLNVEGAINRHRFELQTRSHRCKPLLADWVASGPERFAFEVIDTVKERDDPAFDRAGELQDLQHLWNEEFDRRGVDRYPQVQNSVAGLTR
jgi:hypothetical protein